MDQDQPTTPAPQNNPGQVPQDDGANGSLPVSDPGVPAPVPDGSTQPLPQDNATPFSPPSDVPQDNLNPSHPSTDSNVQPEEVYDEGLSDGAEAEDPDTQHPAM